MFIEFLFILAPFGFGFLKGEPKPVLPHIRGPSNFIFRKFFDCADRSTSIKALMTPRWLNITYQVIDIDFTTPIPMGDNLLIKMSASIFVRETWVHLPDMSCTVCQFFKNYIGPLRSDLLQPLGISPDTCPIQMGTYHGRNVHVDMQKSRLPEFLYGSFKVHLAFHNVINDNLELCVGILFENKPLE